MLLFILVIGGFVVFFAYKNAPEGEERENGFFYVPQKEEEIHDHEFKHVI
jgi:hypothetical protein